jgi:hypothetical protein
MSLDVTISDLIRAFLERDRDSLHVSLPGKILRYVAPLADIEISLKHFTPAGEFEEYPTLVGVPVSQPRTKDFALAFPIAAGDRCMVHFADVNLAEWRDADGAESGDPERHGLAGAWATLGGYPDAEAWAPSPAAGGPILEHRTGGRLQVTSARVECGRTAPLPLPTKASVEAALAGLHASLTAIAAAVPTAPPAPLLPIAGTTGLASE